MRKDPISWLYPPIEPHTTGMLPVGDGHVLHYEECGNPRGKPAVFLHGGPGGGIFPIGRQLFDPSRYRIIQFDQRGCGKSTPRGSVEHNTTWDLVEDLEKLRKHLGIARWLVAGNSWGSTLTLAYSETYPEAVSEIIVFGIFLCRKKEIDWFYQKGASFVFPDAFEDYVRPIPPEERDDLVAAFHRRFNSADAQVRLEAARAWALWEGTLVKLIPDPEVIKRFNDAEFALTFARIENHYFMNRSFFESDDQLLRGIDRIRHIPGLIVHGRYDMVCPADTAWDLHKAWPEAEFWMIPDAGHATAEPSKARVIVSATDRFASVWEDRQVRH